MSRYWDDKSGKMSELKGGIVGEVKFIAFGF